MFDKPLYTEIGGRPIVFNLEDIPYSVGLMTKREMIQGLASIQRYNNRMGKGINVLQHTFNMVCLGTRCQMSKETLKNIVLHDIHEIIVGDIISPIKRMAGCTNLDNAAEEIDEAVRQVFDVTISDKSRVEVRDMDMLSLHLEFNYLSSTDLNLDEIEDWSFLPKYVKDMIYYPELTKNLKDVLKLSEETLVDQLLEVLES